MRARKKLVVLLTIIAMISVLALSSCAPKADTGGSTGGGTSGGDAPATEVDQSKETIVFGGARSQSGVFAIFDQTVFGPIYRMWVDKVNADGGLFVKEYDKKMPIELIIYDDKSDIATMSRLYEKLMVEDKVDFLIPPVSTAALYALAPLAEKHGYLLLGAEGGADSLKEQIEACPNFFSVLNIAGNQVPVLLDIFKEVGAKTMYVAYIEDLHGTEYFAMIEELIEGTEYEIVGSSKIPLDMTDFTSVINSAKASGADAFITPCYPDQNIPLVNAAVAMDYNPNLYISGPGVTYDFFQYAIGAAGSPQENIEGMMGFGAWNEKSGDGAKAFREQFVAAFGPEGDNTLNNPDAGDKEINQDWWGHLQYQVVVDVLEQAIVGAGTLDNHTVAQYIKDNKFETSMGEVYFVDNFVAPECYVGNIGQWQSGIFEVVDPGANRTADPIYPKPAWPK